MSTAAPSRPQRRGPGDDALTARLRAAALALAVGAPLALGGAHPVAECAIWLAALAMLLIHSVRSARDPEAGAVPWTAIALVVVAFGTLLRSTSAGAPLGSAPVREAWALWPDLDARGSAIPALGSLAALRLAGLAAAIRLGAVLFAGRAERLRLGGAVVAGALLSLGIGLMQEASGSSRVLFVYAPQQVERALSALSGPFVNPNQAGALGALAVPLALYGALRITDGLRRWLLAAAGTVLMAWIAVLDAGAALLAAVAGTIVLAAGELGIRLGGENRAARLAALLGAAMVVGIAVVAVSPLRELLVAVVSPAQLAKAANWRDALGLVATAPVFGHGVGAWSDLAPGVLAESATLRRGYVESATVQFALEHGLLATALLVGALAADLGRWLVGRGGAMSAPWRVLAAALLTTIGVEYTLGLGHQAGAVALAVGLLVGSMIGTGHSQTRRAGRAAPHRMPAPLAVAADVAPVVAAALAFGGLGEAIDIRRGATERAAASLAEGTTTTELRSVLPTLAARSPMSPSIVALGVLAAERDGDAVLADRRLQWLQQRAPRYAGTWGAALAIAQHRNLPELLCDATRELLELGDSGTHIGDVVGDPAAAARCVPPSEHARALLFERMLRERRVLDVLLLAGEVLRTEPDSPAALAAATRSALESGMAPGALRYAAELRRVRPEQPQGWLLGAEAATQNRDPALALALLDDGVGRHPGQVDLLLARAEARVLAAERGELPDDWRDAVRADLEAAAPATVGRPGLQRTHGLLRARAALAAGDARRAGAILDTLLERNASDIYTVRLRARAAAQAGDTREAAVWWMRLLELAPGDPEATRATQDR